MVIAGYIDDGPDAPLYEERHCRKCKALLVLKGEIVDLWVCKCCDQAPVTCPHQAVSASG